MSLMFETIEHEMTHDFDAESDAPFIGIKIRAVQGCRGRLEGIFYAEKKVESRDFLREVGKIFGNHLRFDFLDIPLSQGTG